MAGKRVGRPSAYREEYAEQAARLALLGMTNQEMAKFFQTSHETLNRWMNTYPKFHDAIKNGREPADGQVVASLFRRACGYTTEEDDIRVAGGQVVITPIMKHYPPDPMACMYWLNNRQRGRWSRNPNPAGGDDDIPPTMISFEVEDGRTRPDSATEA